MTSVADPTRRLARLEDWIEGRTTPRTADVHVLVWCKACRHRRDADLQALVDAGKGDVPLSQLRFLCSNCGSSLTDSVVTLKDEPRPWWMLNPHGRGAIKSQEVVQPPTTAQAEGGPPGGDVMVAGDVCLKHGAAKASASQLFSGAIDRHGDGVALVVAHPDDEVIGLGGHLAMLQRGIQVVHLNSGSVDNDVWPRKCGFADRYHYRAKRAAELAEVLRLSGIAREQWCCFDIPDLEAPFHLVASIERLARIFAQHDTRLVFTHAYEGGNPDHDACAFIVWAAVSLLKRDIPILEMPYYRQWAYAWLRPRLVLQSFIPNGESIYGRLLTPEQREQKRRLLAVYQSQCEALRDFSVEREYFRRAQPVQGLPNNGRLALYKEAGLPAEKWLRLMSCARAELAVDDHSPDKISVKPSHVTARKIVPAFGDSTDR